MAPADEVDYHRDVPAGLDLASVFAVEVERAVANDRTVRYDNRSYQLRGPSRALPPSRGRVTEQRRLDGSLRIFYRDSAVAFHPVPSRTRPAVRTPPADHPWRKPFSARRAAGCSR